MTTLSMFGWKDKLALLCNQLSGIEGLRVEHVDDELRFRTDNCRGVVELTVLDVIQETMKPRMCVTSGAALCGSLEEVSRGVADYRKVLDALRLVAFALEGVTIKLEGVTIKEL